MSESDDIRAITQSTLKAFQKFSPEIIERVVIRSLKSKEEVIQHGDEAAQIIRSGLRFTTQMLESAMAVGEISLLEDQLKWALDRLPHDGVAPDHIMNRLQIYLEEMEVVLPSEQSTEIAPYLAWMISRMKELTQASKTTLPYKP